MKIMNWEWKERGEEAIKDENLLDALCDIDYDNFRHVMRLVFPGANYQYRTGEEDDCRETRLDYIKYLVFKIWVNDSELVFETGERKK